MLFWEWGAHQIQDGDLHHTLIEIGGTVLDDFDCDYFLGLEVLAFDDLPECSLTKDIKDQIAILVPIVLVPKYVVDIENIVTVFIVKSIVLDAFAWLCEDTSWVSRRLVFELRIANTVGGGKLRGQCLKRADETAFRVCSSVGWLRVNSRLQVVQRSQTGECGNRSPR